jgi:coiled-coil domain-containing protein 55
MGMQGFYRGIMEDQEKRYQESIQAANEATKSGNLVETVQEKEKTDIEIAEELRGQGKHVLVNEDGQIVDKRETLSAGLNIIKKPKPAGAPKLESKGQVQPVWQRKGGPDLKGMRERQSRMMEEQLAQAAKRAADEEIEKQSKLEHAAKSRKTGTDISSARERYLARKKAADEAKGKAP